MVERTRNELQDSRMEGEDLDTAAIRADIRDTRDRMSQTLDGIGERLNPQLLKERVREEIRDRKDHLKENIREATIGRAGNMARNAAGRMNDTRRGLVDSIRDNPVPAAMVGIGLGWLLFNSRRDDTVRESEYGYWTANGLTFGDRTRLAENQLGQRPIDRASDWAAETTNEVREHAQELTGRASQKVGDIAERTRTAASHAMDRTGAMLNDTTTRARDMAGRMAQRTQQQSGRLEERFHDAVVDSPLVVGAAAIAIGLTAGLAIPSSRRESELMGDSRDRLFDRARDFAEETTGKVRQVAERVATEAQASAREVAEELKTTAKDAAQEQGLMANPSERANRTDSFTSRPGTDTSGSSAMSGSPPSPTTGFSTPDTTGSVTGMAARDVADRTRSETQADGGSIADPRSS